MADDTTSQVQQGTWKKIAESQLDLVESLNAEMVRLRRLGFDKTIESVEEMTRLSKESLDHARDIADPDEPVSAWKDMLDRQVEVVVGINKAWHDLALDSAKRATGWMTRSL